MLSITDRYNTISIDRNWKLKLEKICEKLKLKN